MKVRRVVVANDAGISRVIDDGSPPRTADAVHTPGFGQSLVWATSAIPEVVDVTTDPTAAVVSMVPEPGGTRCILLTFPPDSVYGDPDFDGAAAGAESARNSPGLAELFEPDNPGMHTTPTVDYDVLLDGQLRLALSDGEVDLNPGDIVVQHGTRHAWRNVSDKPATLLAILVGAKVGQNSAESGS